MDFEVSALLHTAGHKSTVGDYRVNTQEIGPAGIGYFKFLPVGGGNLSQTVPEAVKADYEEACLIQHLSPKAAATLARRALQGMIRDFWKITKPSLIEEINALSDHCPADLLDAMHAMRSIGNIGAHPEKDVNTIIDVEPAEVDELVGLIRLLDDEWYVARAARNARLATVKALGAEKAAEKKAARTLPRA